MKIKIQSRQTGKSYDIAQELKKDKNAIVLVMTEMMKAVFIETFNVNKNQVMTFQKALKWLPNKQSKLKIYIDELGYCVQSLFMPHQVIYGTHT